MTKTTMVVVDSDRTEKWQEILSDLITDPKELMALLDLEPATSPHGNDMPLDFPLKVPRTLLSRIKKGDWWDPVLLQVWPAAAETAHTPGYSADPLGENAANPLPGLLHKYHGRVLLTVAPHCAVHCRYCFRREFDYAGNTPALKQWQPVLAYISRETSINEVILSGGDPLALSDRHLAWFIDQIGDISHVSTVRIHTRLPVVIPQRATPGLLNSLQHDRLRIVMVIHTNHAQEIDSEVAHGLGMIGANGVTLMNQSVLLHEVNNNVPVLKALSESLFQAGVLPYYLHLPDRVAGTAHFHVSACEGKQLITQLRAELPGYLVPKLVSEVPGQASKLPAS